MIKSYHLIVPGLLLLVCGNPCANENQLAVLVTDNGTEHHVTHFGTAEENKNYFVRTGNRYHALDDLKAIISIDGEGIQKAYLIVLKNGDFLQGRYGLLFYEKVRYRASRSGQVKHAYTPVLKERGQSGFLFTARKEDQQKVVELANPNTIQSIEFRTSLASLTDKLKLAEGKKN
ncbi:MAG: hypothetical protein OEZ47_13470 [Gammaproteobacteria bacterium]|nr:hypothetical protein [Gammaproteobacteria bacterium]